MLPLTIAINPTKETNIQMILLEEDIQQLRKIKGTGEQTLNFSTLRAAFKWVSWQKVKSKPILNAACCLFITFPHYEETSCCIVIYKLFLSYNNTQRNPQPERRGCLVGKKGGSGNGGGGETTLEGWIFMLISPCTPWSPGLKNLGGRERGR